MGRGRRSVSETARLGAVFALLWVLWAFSRPTVWSMALGTPLVAAGEILRIWAAGHLVKTRCLIVTGPYRYTRNPLYLGRLMILTGLALLAWIPPGWNLVGLVVGWGVFFGYYLPRKERIEPARLEALHGPAYAEYRKAVPALFPLGKAWGKDPGHWQWGFFHANREGWTALGLALLVLVFAWRMVH